MFAVYAGYFYFLWHWDSFLWQWHGAQLILASELTIKMTEALLGVMAPGTARFLVTSFWNF